MKNFQFLPTTGQKQVNFDNFKKDQIDEIWHISGGGACTCISCSWPEDKGKK